MVFQKIIATDYKLLTLQVQGIGQVGTLMEFREAFTVPVTISYALSKQTVYELESVPVKNISVAIKTFLGC